MMRLPFGTIACTVFLVGFLVGGYDVAFGTLPQDSTKPDTSSIVTGRAIPCKDGRIGAFECHNVELLAYLPKSVIGDMSGADVWGWHDSTTRREFVLIGGFRMGTAFVEVTDPVNPQYLGFLPPHDSTLQSHGAQSVKVYKNHAFIGHEIIDNGVQVFDLTQLRNVPSPPAVFRETAHYGEITSSHTLAVNEETGFLYANGSNTCGGALHMVDVRIPTRPTFAGCFLVPVGTSGSGYVHDTQCVVYRGPDQRYRGREICLNASASAVVIVDVTNKQQPKTISIARYPRVGFTHQGWLTEDQRYFFLDDEADEVNISREMGRDSARTRTIVFDLNELDDPVVLTEFRHTTIAVDHNLYIRGRYMYQGNTTVGLRIINVADPRAPREAGYLTGIGWTWGAYPYLKDDVVAVSTSAGLVLARLLAR